MDKYGVDEEEPSPNKTTEDKPKQCPACKSPLRPIEDTGVLICPKCGSKPFEKAGP